MKFKELINQLYEFAFTNPFNQNQKIELGIVDELLAERIKALTSIETEGFVITVDNFGISHTIKKHGNEQYEKKRGQVAVEKNDFHLILEIIYDADHIRLEDGALVFEKQIDQRFFLVKEVRRVVSNSKKNKVSRLILKTMYKK